MILKLITLKNSASFTNKYYISQMVKKQHRKKCFLITFIRFHIVITVYHKNT